MDLSACCSFPALSAPETPLAIRRLLRRCLERDRRRRLADIADARLEIEEAQAGESRSDFIHKLGIARKEGRESLYWLRVMAGSNIVPQRRVQPLGQETEELLTVLRSIILKTKRNSGD